MNEIAGSNGHGAAPGPHRAVHTLAVGLVGGCALGIVARGWMRLIAEDPDFSWNGTIFIVLGFTFFGVTQSAAALARRRNGKRWTMKLARAVGGVGMLPLFVAAGALMLPTVVGAGLAVARRNWHPFARAICLLVAAGPVAFVGSDLVSTFGWSLQSVAGFVGLLAIYSTIIYATRFTFTPPVDARRLSVRTKVTAAIAGTVAVGVPLYLGGIQ